MIFSLSGNQIMPIYDACIDVDIRIIHTRNEASAVYMAEAYAQMSGNIGVALVTAGPGLLNAVSALYSAARSETPVLLLSGDAALAMDGRGGVQELLIQFREHLTSEKPLTTFRALDEAGNATTERRLYGVFAQSVEGGSLNILMLGVDPHLSEPQVLLELMFVDPSQMTQPESASSASSNK